MTHVWNEWTGMIFFPILIAIGINAILRFDDARMGCPSNRPFVPALLMAGVFCLSLTMVKNGLGGWALIFGEWALPLNFLLIMSFPWTFSLAKKEITKETFWFALWSLLIINWCLLTKAGTKFAHRGQWVGFVSLLVLGFAAAVVMILNGTSGRAAKPVPPVPK